MVVNHPYVQQKIAQVEEQFQAWSSAATGLSDKPAVYVHPDARREEEVSSAPAEWQHEGSSHEPQLRAYSDDSQQGEVSEQAATWQHPDARDPNSQEAEVSNEPVASEHPGANTDVN
jgi:hypothetical protein